VIVDAHCHLAPPEAPGAPALKDVDGFLERKAAEGIDVAVVAHSIVNIPGLGGTLERVKRWNEHVLGVHADHPDRVAVMVGVAPLDGDEMLEEARRAVATGSSGFTISSSQDGQRLDAPELEDFWSLAEELDVPVLVHPPVGPGEPGDPRLAEFGTRAVDVGLSLAAAIFAGVLDRHGSLRLIAAAGGGGLAALAGRLDAGYHMPELAGAALKPADAGSSDAQADGGPVPREPPSSYLRRIHADTLLFDEPALRLTIEAFGADRVLFGTDWPPVSVPTSLTLDLVRGLDVPDDVRDGILGGNAARLLRLAPD
jgi:predicted TIM-barrel fold metal-dependent hydrolase